MRTRFLSTLPTMNRTTNRNCDRVRSAFTAVALLAVAGLTPMASAQSTINLGGTVRDFHSYSSYAGYNPDFENENGNDHGIVKNTLGSNGIPVYDLAAHPSGTKTTHVAGSIPYFDQWYKDTSGVNESAHYAISLARVGLTDLYSYSNTSFFPIDNQLFGNEGNNHNFSFTYQLHSAFGYKGGETFNFKGDDDVFVFLNKKLAIDLGGVHGGESASVNLDAVATSLGMSVGHNYDFDLFFAERHTTASDFAITTSIGLQNTDVPEPGRVAMLAAFGVSGGLVMLRRLRRK